MRKSSRKFMQKCMFLIIFLIVFTWLSIFTYQSLSLNNNKLIIEHAKFSLAHGSVDVHSEYLINTSNCKIPNLEPFNHDVEPFFSKENYLKCSQNDFLLSFVEKTEDGLVVLRINESVALEYRSLDCCYSSIERNKNDSAVRKIAPCVPFERKLIVKEPFFQVDCVDSKNGRLVYSNVHAAAQEEKAVLDTFQEEGFSVILVGIDSISKLNLMRTMPKTYSFLQRNFINLKGYNKVADNTFPNLMAILSGLSREEVYKLCKPGVNPMEDCVFLWKDLKKIGYVTAYAEDDCSIATFNYQNWGFVQPPTNYYYRPYMLAAEKLLGNQQIYTMAFCTGPESSGQRIMNAAKDFSVTFQNKSSFGLFWMNSFSHENINYPAVMDEFVVKFLQDSQFVQSLQNTFMVFLSDHGFRFGDIRYTHSGWLEERLPFIYLRLPPKFKDKHPEKLKVLLENANNRLTTPYDLHDTIVHLIQLNNKGFVSGSSKGLSLFKPIPENRTCQEAKIAQHWCTCKMHKYIAPNSQVAQKIANFVLKTINQFIGTFPEQGLCAKYSLKKVVVTGQSDQYLNKMNVQVKYYLIIFETVPRAMFEATVEANFKTNYYQLLGDVSRINKYSGSSFCVNNGLLKKYCYCDGFITKAKVLFCTLLQICL